MKTLFLVLFTLSIHYGFSQNQLSDNNTTEKHEEPAPMPMVSVKSPEGLFIIQLEDPVLAGVIVFSEDGALMFSVALDKEETMLNLTGLDAGVYTLEIQNNGAVYHEDILIEKY